MQPVVHLLHLGCFFIQRATLLLLFPIVPKKPPSFSHSTYHASYPTESFTPLRGPSCATVPNPIPLGDNRGSLPTCPLMDGDHRPWLRLGTLCYQKLCLPQQYNRPASTGAMCMTRQFPPNHTDAVIDKTPLLRIAINPYTTRKEARHTRAELDASSPAHTKTLPSSSGL